MLKVLESGNALCQSSFGDYREGEWYRYQYLKDNRRIYVRVYVAPLGSPDDEPPAQDYLVVGPATFRACFDNRPVI